MAVQARPHRSNMSIKGKYTVLSVPNFQCKDWLLNKHYAGTIPNIMYAFGIFDENKILQGICCYGTPANNHNNMMGNFQQIELVRLVINEGLDKNLLSFFVTKTFNYLTKPMSLISYADVGKNHHGYIYQSTNWVYTGLGGGVDFYIDEELNEIHSRIMSDYRLKFPSMTREEIANKHKWKKAEGTYKHRYFYFIGNKKDKQIWLENVKEKYQILAYPKGDNTRYDASYEPPVNRILF